MVRPKKREMLAFSYLHQRALRKVDPISIERVDRTAIVSDRSPTGSPVTSELSQFDFKTADTWTCNIGRLRVVNDSGSVKVSCRCRPIVLNGKQLEFRPLQTKYRDSGMRLVGSKQLFS